MSLVGYVGKNLMYVIVRDYAARGYAPELGGHALADFREEEYARAYLKILKRQWKAVEKKYPGQHFEWKLYKRWDEQTEKGLRVRWELLEG